eukprot:gene11526-24114_t
MEIINNFQNSYLSPCSKYLGIFAGDGQQRQAVDSPSTISFAHCTLLVTQFIFSSSMVTGFRTFNRFTSHKAGYRSLNMIGDIHHHIVDIANNIEPIINSNFLSTQSFLTAADEAVSIYSKVDKTGFIGFIADAIEQGIDFGHATLQKAGIQNTYGFSIVIFTVLIKALTLPLTTKQLESTAKMQKLQPLQAKIQAKYATDEQTKNKLMAELFQTANVNPLAGCLPALVQIPIFISLYRALQNLVAEDKLAEPFLWIPDLEGPVYRSPPSESLDWVKSIVTGAPNLGWHDTLAFLTLPVILYVSQSISTKVLQPPKDPNKVLTEQEQFSQGLLNNIPFIIAFFSLNVPSGLAVYWIVNNILTTLLTTVIKGQFKDETLPLEVVTMMAAIDGDSSSTAAKRNAPSSVQELRRSSMMMEDKPKPGGFGNVSDSTEGTEASEGEEEDDKSTVDEPTDSTQSEDDAGKKRKKRVKPASSKKRG